MDAHYARAHAGGVRLTMRMFIVAAIIISGPVVLMVVPGVYWNSCYPSKCSQGMGWLFLVTFLSFFAVWILAFSVFLKGFITNNPNGDSKNT